MRKTLLLITILFISAASFALSDMVSVDFIDGSRTVPIEDLKDMYYSNTKDSFYLALEDTTYAFLADSSLHVSFLDSIEGQHKREREALIAIYHALDGDNWTNNENWCSNTPLNEWYGVRINEQGFVSMIELSNNKLEGVFPKELNNLACLENLSIMNNRVTGTLDIFCKNKKLYSLDLRQNLFLGTIPEEFCELPLANANSAYALQLSYNSLSGTIPVRFLETNVWMYGWGSILNSKDELLFGQGNDFDINDSSFYIPAPEELGGIDLSSKYSLNKYTILYNWATCDGYWETMLRLYEYFYDKGVRIISWNNFDGDSFWKEYGLNTMDIDEYTLLCDSLTWEQYPGDPSYPQSTYIVDMMIRSWITVINEEGLVVWSNLLEPNSSLIPFLNQCLQGELESPYLSSNYSQDGSCEILQTASVGNGIDILLMGDGYSDRQIAEGKYNNDMQYAYNSIFSIEPYKSFKELFNVKYVNVVSPNEGYDYDNNITTLGCKFGSGTFVYGNDNKVFEYTQRVLSKEKIDDATIIVVMNSDNDAGVCNMYYPEKTINTYGSGVSISYFSKGTDSISFAQTLHHEALGHGFAKLADEYAYESSGPVPISAVDLHKEQQTNWGWWKNIDFTNDSAEIRWSRLLLDERYQYDGLGAFEGGLTYWTGVWRPTENSIMRYNTGGFNAPSREAIYYRIHKLAYGEEWEYDYEKFVEWDAKNRKIADSPLLMPSREAVRNFVPTHPPVIKQMNWREALESEQTPQRSQIKAKEGAPVYDKSINQLPNTNKYVFTTYLNDEQ